MTNGMVFWPLVLGVAISIAAGQYRYAVAISVVLVLFITSVGATTRR